jgi:hypothetical protein
MTETIRNNPDFHDRFARSDAAFKRWFESTANSIFYFDIDERAIMDGTDDAEQFFSLAWQQFGAHVVADEPNNALASASLFDADDRMRNAFTKHGTPNELLED